MATGRQLHIDVPLTNMTVAAFNSGMDQFIAQKVFPVVPVDKQSNKYYTLTADAFLRQHDTRRSPKSVANKVEFSVSSDSYFANEYALGHDIPLQDLANADTALTVRQNGTTLVQLGLLRDLEIRVANKITSGTNLGSYVSLSGAAGAWKNFANSDPIGDITSGHAFIRNGTGLMANTLILDYDTLTIVRRHPALLDMYKYTSGGELTDAQLMQVFKVQQILSGNGVKSVAIEGQTSSITNIWPNCAVLARIENAVSLQTATFGLGMRWTPEGFPAPFTVGRQAFTGPGTANVETLEGGYWQDEKIVAKALSYGILNTLG